MNLKTFAILICASIMSLQTAVLAAPSMPANPHEQAPKETGIITGVLRSPSGEAIGGHQVSLNIFQMDQMVLKLPKKTDPSGKYQFRNIFPSTDFHYIIDTEYEGKLYSTKPASLSPKEKLIQLDLVIGNDSMVQSEAAGEMEHNHDEYQILAILLSIGVIGYLVFSRKKKTKS